MAQFLVLHRKQQDETVAIQPDRIDVFTVPVGGPVTVYASGRSDAIIIEEDLGTLYAMLRYAKNNPEETFIIYDTVRRSLGIRKAAG